MTPLVERQKLVNWIDEAYSHGSRLQPACAEADITIRTYQRWHRAGEVCGDARPKAVRPAPSHSLSTEERQHILATVNELRFANLPPSQIVPALADEGVYIASESSFYRVLKAAKQLAHRGRTKAPVKRTMTTHVANAPNQLWSWDITYLPSGVHGLWFYLYLVMDVYSRKIVAWDIHDTESGEHAAALITRGYLSENIALNQQPLVLHSDNGAPMKSATLRARLEFLGVAASYSRPRVSNDNAYSESLFGTLKYRPDYPAQGFVSIEQAQTWVLQFVHWYNESHYHSGIAYLTPGLRHSSNGDQVLAQRDHVYAAAKARTPARWSGTTRRWIAPNEVWLNPENKNTVTMLDVA